MYSLACPWSHLDSGRCCVAAVRQLFLAPHNSLHPISPQIYRQYMHHIECIHNHTHRYLNMYIEYTYINTTTYTQVYSTHTHVTHVFLRQLFHQTVRLPSSPRHLGRWWHTMHNTPHTKQNTQQTQYLLQKWIVFFYSKGSIVFSTQRIQLSSLPFFDHIFAPLFSCSASLFLAFFFFFIQSTMYHCCRKNCPLTKRKVFSKLKLAASNIKTLLKTLCCSLTKIRTGSFNIENYSLAKVRTANAHTYTLRQSLTHRHSLNHSPTHPHSQIIFFYNLLRNRMCGLAPYGSRTYQRCGIIFINNDRICPAGHRPLTQQVFWVLFQKWNYEMATVINVWPGIH